MDEHDAIMIVYGGVNRLGEITSVNSKSSLMLGMQRVVLTGRYLHSLFPAPLSAWIQQQVRPTALLHHIAL